METQAIIGGNQERKGVGMNLTFLEIAGIMLLLLAIIATGFWVSSGEKPYNSGIFTLHKLISVAAVVILTVITIKTGRASGLNGYELICVAVTGLLFLGTLVTGGMLSVDKVMPAIVLRMHHILPFLTTASTGITLFVLK